MEIGNADRAAMVATSFMPDDIFVFLLNMKSVLHYLCKGYINMLTLNKLTYDTKINNKIIGTNTIHLGAASTSA